MLDLMIPILQSEWQLAGYHYHYQYYYYCYHQYFYHYYYYYTYHYSNHNYYYISILIIPPLQSEWQLAGDPMCPSSHCPEPRHVLPCLKISEDQSLEIQEEDQRLEDQSLEDQSLEIQNFQKKIRPKLS